MVERRGAEPKSAKAQTRQAATRKAVKDAHEAVQSKVGPFYVLDLVSRVRLLALYDNYGAGTPPCPRGGILLHAISEDKPPQRFEKRKDAEAAITRTCTYINQVFPSMNVSRPEMFHIMTENEVAWMQMSPAQRRKASGRTIKHAES